MNSANNPPPYRILIVVSHPIPYIIPLFRLMVKQKWDFQVAYCSLEGAESYRDRDFATEVTWDVPLLEGYPWTHVPNISPKPGLSKFFGLVNPQLMQLVQASDVIIVYTGYAYASFWLTALAAKLQGKGFIFSTDTSSLSSRSGRSWKAKIKPFLLPQIYHLGDAILVSTRFGKQTIASLDIPEERIFITPFVADNDWWLAQAAQVDRAQVRQEWQIPLDATVLTFCAKLQPWKRPQDILEAFARANVPNSYLLYVGDGAMRSQLEMRTKELELGDRVKFLGFLNQSQLPAVYKAADLLCLCSEYEPFGVVVNEAMLCECGAIVSDRVGARELVEPGKTGYIYPWGNIDKLCATLQLIIPQKEKLKKMGKNAKKRMEKWSPQENIKAQENAISFIMNNK
ncbi:glycosyltransferase family 4 protein [Spirulina sp. 06S082]|uniref:glycosyltransferase family 4 protein n=1 Tax=Spirulina sp. 06S082 TaxID=3110248 RepID=UPI002B207BA7|nr:glycosyltransferase family 4 protein [Spirulina sp. 06S082]MEA5469615.1 glycosyltransferase family 4 protein [Spirulina sp. 06S082]